MPRLLRLAAPEYEFTDEELVQATTLSEVQQQFIQTQIAQLITEKNNISYSPDEGDPERRYIIEHEVKRGQLIAFQYLLDCHDGAKETLRLMQQRQVEARSRDGG